MAAPSAERRPRLAIVGASCRAAAFSALRAGYEVVTADLFADEDLRRVAEAHCVSDYPHGFEDWLAKVDADAWMYTGALENHPDLVDRMARIKPLWGIGGDALRAVRDYSNLRDHLARAGLRVPETRHSAHGLPLGGEWLCKTHSGSSGSGVWALDSRAALLRAQDEGAQFQRSLDVGWPGAAVFALSGGGSVTLGVTRQVVGDPLSGAAPFQYAGSIYPPPPLSEAAADELTRLRRLLAEGLGLRGLVGVDLWFDESHAWVLEVNPRYTASVEVLERATGRCALRSYAPIRGGARTGATEWKAHRASPAVGKLIYFAKREARISNGFSRWALSHSGVRCWPGVSDAPAPGQLIPRGRPVVTLLAAGEEPAPEPLFAERVAELERRLYADA